MAYNIFILDLNKWNVWFDGQKPGVGQLKTVKNWAIDKKADLCFNLGYFNFSDKLSVTYVKNPQGVISEGGWSDIVRFNGNECRGYSNAIVHGITNVQYPRRDVRTRNGIGITQSGKVIIAQTSHKVSEITFANYVNHFVAKRYEVVELFVLQDGGGSTSQYSNRSKLNFAPEGSRAVATVTCANYIGKEKITRVLCSGKSGEDVRLLQTIIGGIEADGIYGSGTKSRVKATQRALGLVADGIAGQLTLRALGLRW